MSYIRGVFRNGTMTEGYRQTKPHNKYDIMNSKPIIYQVLPRLWGNDNANLVKNGSLSQNGTGKFSDIDTDTIEYLK